MRFQKVKFENNQGILLSARLELPLDQHPHHFVLFAHCFTCNKNLTAIRNISQTLTLAGFAVLRFDFTGLGESEGDFADTNFSSNVEDLVAAADFLAKEYQAPSLLIGHSLGGAAVIYAAKKLTEVKAVVTIGAPADPAHVSHLLKSDKATIEREGVAEVSIGGRPFKIKKSFLEDLQNRKMEDCLQNLDRAILILHSPQDNIVGIENAAKIYNAAWHPKSFISLDGADHLLTNKADSRYVGEVIASWVKRYLEIPESEPLSTDQQVVARTGKEDYTTEIKIGKHGFIADEPIEVGGNDFGPTPYGLLTAALAACTSMTLRMYADRKGWNLSEIKVHVSHDKVHASKKNQENRMGNQIDQFERYIELEGDLDEKQKNRMLQIADKCPVHKTLHNEINIKTELKS